jgi:hypothetical protein
MTNLRNLLRDIRGFLDCNSFGETGTRDDDGLCARIDAAIAELPDEPTREPRKTRYCDYDLCPATFDPAHSNNDH